MRPLPRPVARRALRRALSRLSRLLRPPPPPAQAICGYTWPGIEHGEPPSCPYTFFEYADAARFGDLGRLRAIEAACAGWWHPTLDRGAGALLHIAADHGQLALARHLVEVRRVPVNQRDAISGWTPLHRAARVAHYRHAPCMATFEYLLSAGADAALLTRDGRSVIDLAVERGHEWAPGEVRRRLAAAVAAAAGVPKAPESVHAGPGVGPEAARVLAAWEAAPKLYPPRGWRPPPPPGCEGAPGMRLHAREPWRPVSRRRLLEPQRALFSHRKTPPPPAHAHRPPPAPRAQAGDGDGSTFMRPMTPEEMQAMSLAA